MVEYHVKFWDEDCCMNDGYLTVNQTDSSKALVELSKYLADNKYHYQVVTSIERVKREDE